MTLLSPPKRVHAAQKLKQAASPQVQLSNSHSLLLGNQNWSAPGKTALQPAARSWSISGLIRTNHRHNAEQEECRLDIQRDGACSKALQWDLHSKRAAAGLGRSSRFQGAGRELGTLRRWWPHAAAEREERSFRGSIPMGLALHPLPHLLSQAFGIQSFPIAWLETPSPGLRCNKPWKSVQQEAPPHRGIFRR